MKKIFALSLVLAAATIAKGAVPSSVEVRRGGLIPTNSPTAGLYLASDGSNTFWAIVTASNTNIPPYTLTNNQSSAVTLLNDLSVSQLLELPGTGGGTGARIAGRADAGSLNITNFIRNFGWVTTDGPLTNAVGLFNANDSPSYFLNLAGAIAGIVSASSLQNTNVVTTNAYVGVLRVSGLQTNSTDQRIVGSNPKLYVQALSAPNTTFLDAHGLGTVSGGSQPYIIFSVEGNQVLYLTDTNFLPAPGINYSLGQGAAGNIFSGVFASNVTIYTSVTNKYLPTNSLLRVGPGGIITTSIIGSGLSLAADGTLSASGALTWSGEAEFDSIIVTNTSAQVMSDLGATTNAVATWAGPDVLNWWPSNNASLTFSDTPSAGVEIIKRITLHATNASMTSLVIPFAGQNGETNLDIPTPPSTSTITVVWDGYTNWIETSYSGLDSTQFSSDGRAIKDGALLTNASSRTTFLLPRSSLGTTVTRSLILTNGTDAAAGAQQVSPAIMLAGSGWKTTATAASQPIEAGWYMLPVQGSTAPTARMKFIFAVNGGAVIDNGPYFETTATQGDFYAPGIGRIGTMQFSGTILFQNPSAVIVLNVGTSTNNAAFSSSACFIRLTNSLASANYDITGISTLAQQNIMAVQLCNLSKDSANTITLKHENASSTAGYRFHGPGNADYILKAGSVVWIYSVYDGVDYRWRVGDN